MLPLYDESRISPKKPLLTIGLIAINLLVFLIMAFRPNFEDIIYEWGLIPARILAKQGLSTLISSMFLHAGLAHLIGNIWFLWVFGDNLERDLGKLKFLIFYLSTGILASLIHIFTVSSVDLFIPVIGASGAISGILGGYVVLFPHNKIKAFFMGYFRPYFFSIPAWFYALVWFGYQLLYAGTQSSIAYMAHIGGFFSGMILVLVFGKRIMKKDYLLHRV